MAYVEAYQDGILVASGYQKKVLAMLGERPKGGTYEIKIVARKSKRAATVPVRTSFLNNGRIIVRSWLEGSHTLNYPEMLCEYSM